VNVSDAPEVRLNLKMNVTLQAERRTDTDAFHNAW